MSKSKALPADEYDRAYRAFVEAMGMNPDEVVGFSGGTKESRFLTVKDHGNGDGEVKVVNVLRNHRE